LKKNLGVPLRLFKEKEVQWARKGGVTGKKKRTSDVILYYIATTFCCSMEEKDPFEGE